MFKRLLLVGVLVAGAWAADDVFDDNNFNLDVSTNFCAGTVGMSGNPTRKGDTMRVACVGNTLFSAKEEPSKVVTPIVNLGYRCYCNPHGTGGAPKGVVVNFRDQWSEY